MSGDKQLMRPGALPWLWVSVVVIALDQVTKRMITARFELYDRIEIWSILDITRLHNTGAAFSFLSDAGGWQRYFFSVLALVISVALIVRLYTVPRGQWLFALSLSLILAGALGNVWDRVALGYVVDFISVHYDRHYFPAFNLADSAISVGAACLLLDSFLARDSAGHNERSDNSERNGG